MAAMKVFEMAAKTAATKGMKLVERKVASKALWSVASRVCLSAASMVAWMGDCSVAQSA